MQIQRYMIIWIKNPNYYRKIENYYAGTEKNMRNKDNKYINRNITKRDISKGDLVLYYTWDRVKGIQRKHYTLLYSGPYKVIRRKRNTKVIEIENVKNKKERLFVNVDRLKKYYTPAVNKI